MSPSAAPWAAWVLTYLLHSTVLIVGALLIARWLPARRAAWQDTLWKTALFGGLVTSVLSTSGLTGSVGPVHTLELPIADQAVASAQHPGLRVALEGADTADSSEITEFVVRDAAGDHSPSTPPLAGWVGARALPTEIALRSARSEHARIAEENDHSAPRNGQATAPAQLVFLIEAENLTPGQALDPPAQIDLKIDSTLFPLSAHLSPEVPGSGLAWVRPATLPGVRATDLTPRFVALVLAICGLGALVGCVRWLRAWSCLQRALRGRAELRSGPVFARLERLRQHTGARRVRLSVSDALATPITVGWLRAEICLPRRALSELAEEDLDNVLAHELAHVQRADPAWLAAIQLLERLFFFQPLQRLAAARWRENAEVLCDDQAVRWTGHRLGFARSLTQVAAWLVPPAPRGIAAHGAAGMAAEPSQLRQRIERLLDDSAVVAPASGRRPVACAALAACILLVPGVRAGTTAKSDPAPSAAPVHDAPAAPSPTAILAPLPAPASAPAPELPATPAPLPTVPSAPRLEWPLATPTPPAIQSRAALESTLGREMRVLRADLAELHAQIDADPALSDLHERTLELEVRMQRLSARSERAIALLEALLAEQ